MKCHCEIVHFCLLLPGGALGSNPNLYVWCWIKILRDFNVLIFRACYYGEPPSVLPPWGTPVLTAGVNQCQAWMPAGWESPWEGHQCPSEQTLGAHLFLCGCGHLLKLLQSHLHMAALREQQPMPCITSIKITWHIYHLHVVLWCYLVFCLHLKIRMSHFPQVVFFNRHVSDLK